MSLQNNSVIALHGGAGTISRSALTKELERAYRDGLENALAHGWDILRVRGNALDAVTAAVCALEDNPLFNAGRGAVFTHDEKHELDASIMCGANLAAGSVAAVSNLKNPILLARQVMEQTEHVMLVGAGAMEFARREDFEFVADDYFFTEFRYQQLKEAQHADRVQLDHAGDTSSTLAAEKKIGTVGAVACDAKGNLAAATSTGGMTNKKFGRVGDTPLIGAGTYAANDTCAVSCTGHGEFFMRGVTAYDVACRMKYGRQSLLEAAAATIEELRAVGGEGGLIAVDQNGNVTLPFNSDGMYRAWRNAEQVNCEIYRH